MKELRYAYLIICIIATGSGGATIVCIHNVFKTEHFREFVALAVIFGLFFLGGSWSAEAIADHLVEEKS